MLQLDILHRLTPLAVLSWIFHFAVCSVSYWSERISDLQLR